MVGEKELQILKEYLRKDPLARRLFEKKLVTVEQLWEALQIKKEQRTRNIAEILYELGYLSKEDFLKEVSAELNIPYLEKLEGVRMRDIKIPASILKQILAVPIEVRFNKVKVAMADPLNWNAEAYIRRFYPNRKIEKYLAFKEDILKVIKVLENREKIQSIIADIKRELRGEEVVGEDSAIVRLIKYIVFNAIDRKASDIHIEAEENYGEVRLRIFGTLYEFLDFDKEIFNALASRLKLMAGVDPSERRKPQDGAFSMEYDGNKFDFRFSSLPTVWGESLVIRILDKRNILKKIDEIGISEKNLALMKKALAMPNGIFLVTGPTGSGKSTTLYASLNAVVGVDKKVITVEDPVEYKLPGIQQVQVNPKVDMTFAAALRSILRQDPDIIMIGEIRDLETLEIAIKAALTGHLVLSTLHTNDAVSAISRMIDMGVDPFMVASSLIGVEAQRLVKTNCPYCKVQYKPADIYLEPIRNHLPKDAKFYRGKGCEKCNMTGFAGRTLISEVFLTDEVLESKIAKNKEKLEILSYLRQKGYRTMFFDGLIKALEGITPLEEVYRVAKL